MRRSGNGYLGKMTHRQSEATESHIDVSQEQNHHLEGNSKQTPSDVHCDAKGAKTAVGRTALYELFVNGSHCDCELRLAEGRSLAVHAAIMAAAMPYFEALFLQDHNQCRHQPLQQDKVQESATSWPYRATLENIEHNTMCAVVQHVYTQSTDINVENAVDLFMAADFLNYQPLLDDVYGFIDQQLQPDNCFALQKLADHHSCRQLERRVYDYIMFNFVEIADSQDKNNLLELSVEKLCGMLGSDDLNVKSEETVWSVILEWINHEPSARRQHIPVLLAQMRLGLLDKEFFEQVVQRHPLVVNNHLCDALLDQTRQFFASIEQPRDGELVTAFTTTPRFAQPRYPHEILFALGGWSGQNPTACIETYDTRADRWVPAACEDPQGARAYHGMVALGHHIYVIGGFDGTRRFNSCRRFDAVQRSWHEVAPMHEQRCYVSVAVLDGCIYAMGGSDGYTRHKSVERYSPALNQWTMVASMCVPRSDASATTLDGRIYICGGFNGHDCLSTCEVYEPSRNTWSLIASMRSRRSGVSCVALHDRLFVIGGFNGIMRLSSGERYCPQSAAWTPMPDMYAPRSNFAVEVIDDMIFAIGGYNGSTTTVQVECYDEQKAEWYEATDMGINRSALSACVIARLPNRMDYVHKQRDRLLEEKRLRLLGTPVSQHVPPRARQPAALSPQQTSSEESVL